MGVVTRKGKTSSNDNHDLQQQLAREVQKPTYSPDKAPSIAPTCAIVSSKIKLKELTLELSRTVFGRAENYYHPTVIEFQKRGLVHAHIVVKLKGFLSPEGRHEVDKWIGANLPDERIANGKLREKSLSIRYIKHLVSSFPTHLA